MNNKNLLRLAQLYASYMGLSISSVSTYVAGSGRAFARLEDGHTITLRRWSEIVQKFSDGWPDDLPWPAHIQRQEPVATEAGSQPKEAA